MAKKLLDRSPKPTAWLSSDDLLRPANEAMVDFFINDEGEAPVAEWELNGILGNLLVLI